MSFTEIIQVFKVFFWHKVVHIALIFLFMSVGFVVMPHPSLLKICGFFFPLEQSLWGFINITDLSKEQLLVLLISLLLTHFLFKSERARVGEGPREREGKREF